MYEYKAKITNIVDGDTVDAIVDLGFDIKFEMRLRLYGINTPEIRTKDLEEKARGFAAKTKVQEMIGEQEVMIKTHKDKAGKYGRILAEIFELHEYMNDSPISVNTKLLQEGFAKPYKE